MKQLAVMLVIAAAVDARCHGGDGSLTTFNYGRPNDSRAIAVEIDSRWLAGEGYRPVRVKLRPLNKPRFTQDRQVTLQLNRYYQWREFPRELTEQVIELPEGAARVSVTINVPQNRIQGVMEYQFWEGRRTLRNVLRNPVKASSSSITMRESAPSLLVVDFDVPSWKDRDNLDRYRGSPNAGDPEGLDQVVPSAVSLVGGVPSMLDATTTWKAANSWVDVSEQVATCEYLAPADLPEEWLSLSGVDIIYISLGDLLRLRGEHFEQWRVLDAWLRAGGMLWIAGVGDGTAPDTERFARRDEVAALFSGLSAGIEEAENPKLAGWQTPRNLNYGEPLNVFAHSGYQSTNAWVPSNANRPPPNKLPASDPAPFGFRACQLGTVVIWADDTPLANTDPWHWEWVFSSLEPTRWMWSRRQGVSKLVQNNEFFSFLIPGVGLAPVNSFRVMMTLFVIIIGPLNFSILKRWNRLNWMLYTVPACALVATLGIIGYAAVADGTTVRAQLRSLTYIDQQADHAVTWSRQSYYAGIAPPGGAAFPADVAVAPVLYDPLDRMRFSAQPRRVEWGRRQRLAQGFLASRNTTHFLVQRSRDTELELQFQSGEPHFTNRLGGTILALLVRDEDGNYFTCQDIDQAGRGTLVAIGDDQRTSFFYELPYRRPGLPAGVSVDLYQQHDSSIWLYRNANVGLQSPRFATSRMGRLIGYWTEQHQIPRASYLALMKSCGEVPVGVESPDEVNSCCFVFGTYDPQEL